MRPAGGARTRSSSCCTGRHLRLNARSPRPPQLQDVNGPCPLLAIANVLLLRNQLQLPAGVGEVSQARVGRGRCRAMRRGGIARLLHTCGGAVPQLTLGALALLPPAHPRSLAWWRWWPASCWTATAWRARAGRR